jgi:uncharacterized lipoprotein YmbA
VSPLRIPAAALAAILAAGCSLLAPASDPSRFFVLTALVPPAPDGPPLTLGVGPITLAAYLGVPEIQTRVNATEMRRSPIDRWGEPLADGLQRVLAQDLSAELGTRDVVLFPWYAEEQPGVQVAASIRRFELEPDGSAVLEARYEVTRPGGGGVLRDVAIRKAPSGSGMAASVTALSEALADLAREIARDVAQGRR